MNDWRSFQPGERHIYVTAKRDDIIQTLVDFTNFTCAWYLPKVMRDASVELVACFQQLTMAALLFQTVLNFCQSHVACTDLLRRQFTCQTNFDHKHF